MRVLEVVLTRVADVENVGDAESCDHLAIFCMLPFSKIHFLREHFITKFFGDRWLRSDRLLVLVTNELFVRLLIVFKGLQADVSFRDALLLQCFEEQETVS